MPICADRMKYLICGFVLDLPCAIQNSLWKETGYFQLPNNSNFFQQPHVHVLTHFPVSDSIK